MSTDIHPPNPYDAADAAGIATICGWCPELHILKLSRRDLDVIVVMQMGKGVQDVQIQRNGEPLTISHGICASCKAAQLAGLVHAVYVTPSGRVDEVSRETAAPVSAENAAETGAGSIQEDKQTPAPAALLAERNALRSSLREAIGAIQIFHGPGWELYRDHSPEMKRWKALLG